MQTKSFITLMLLFIFEICFSQTYQINSDISKTFGFAHFKGTYGNETAQLEILYKKKTGIAIPLYLYAKNISLQPLGLMTDPLFIRADTVIDEATYQRDAPLYLGTTIRIKEWITFDGKKSLNNNSLLFDFRRNSNLPDTGLCCEFNDNRIIGSFLNNYTKFIGNRSNDSLKIKPIILFRDTANEKKYMQELNEINKLMYQKYTKQSLHLISITYLNDTFISGIFNLENTNRDYLYGSFDGPTKLKAFTFLRKQHTLINTSNIFSDTFNNKRVGNFSVPTERQLGGLDERGRMGILYNYPPDANLNIFYLTEKGVVFVWVMKEGRGRNPGYSYFEIQYIIPYEWLEKSEYNKVMKLLQ